MGKFGVPADLVDGDDDEVKREATLLSSMSGHLVSPSFPSSLPPSLSSLIHVHFISLIYITAHNHNQSGY